MRAPEKKRNMRSRLARELRYEWPRCKYLHKAITVQEGSVAEEGVSMPIRYGPEAIVNLVEYTAHIRAPSLDALHERAWVLYRAELQHSINSGETRKQIVISSNARCCFRCSQGQTMPFADGRGRDRFAYAARLSFSSSPLLIPESDPGTGELPARRNGRWACELGQRIEWVRLVKEQ